jgi:hypothetical protein
MKVVYTGQPERRYAEFKDVDGVLTDPTRPRISIFAPSGEVVVDSATPTQESTGIYYYLLSVTTAYATERGVYQEWWEGFINSAPISLDEPFYFEVQDIPTIPSSTAFGRSFVRQIRNAISDNDESNGYMIHPIDLNYFIQDGVRNANSDFNFGYHVVVSTAGNNKSGRIDFYYGETATSLPNNARTWYAIHTVKDIMESETRRSMYGPGIINAGDIKVNVAFGLKEQIKYLEMLKKDINKLEMDLKLNGTTGYWINNYQVKDLAVSSG